MPDVSELVVRAKPDGLDETTDGLENMEESFDETAESVGDSADEMNDFSSKWAGAMGAIVAGLAVASAGLLAQVPVLGEVFSGLVAIIEALAFQMDQFLRPALTPLTNLFFDISSAIYELDGAVGDIVGGITTLVSVAVPVIAALSRLGFISFSVTGLLRGLVSVIFGLVSGSIAIGAIIGTIIGLFGVWVLKVTGVLDAIKGLGEWVANSFPNWVRDGILAVIALFGALPTVLGAFIIGALEGGFDEGVERALEAWDILIQGLGRFGLHIRNIFEDAFDWVMDQIQAIVDWIQQKIDQIMGIGGDILTNNPVHGAGQWVGERLDGGGGGGGGGNTTQTTNGNTTVSLDGRRMTEDTGRYRSDVTSRRGRFG